MVQKAITMDKFIQNIRKELQHDLPGYNAQIKMAPKGLNRYDFIPAHKGAVMILLYEKAGRPHLVFIERANDGGPHSGQISLPGGYFDDIDKTLVHTAIRETNEEINVPVSGVEVIGTLTPLNIIVSNIQVLPVVGYYKGAIEFRIQISEVKDILEVNLYDMLSSDIVREKEFSNSVKTILAPYYDVCGAQIWGATAMIMAEFLDIVRKV